MKIQISLGSNKYFYGMRLRPFGIASQPKGHIEFIPLEDISRDIKSKWKDERSYRHGIVVYPKKLKERDIDHYSLTDLNELTDEEKWEAFYKFAKEVKDHEIDFEEFVDESVNRRGYNFDENPLRKEKPRKLFELLVKNGYIGNLKGLEQFYEEL